VQCKYCQSRALSDKVAHLIGCTVFEQQHPALYAEVEEQQGGRAVTAPPAPAAAGGLAASSGSTAAAPAGLSGSNRSRTLHGWVAKGNASSAAGQDQQIHAALLLFFVMCNIPFRVVESPHFLRLLNQLRPNYSAQSGSASALPEGAASLPLPLPPPPPPQQQAANSSAPAGELAAAAPAAAATLSLQPAWRRRRGRQHFLRH